VAYSPDGTLLASGDFTGVVKIWEISSGQCLRTLRGSPKAIVALVFTPDGQTLLSSNTQDLVTTWDVQSGDRLKTIPGIGDTYWLGSVAFCTDGSLLAATSADQTVKVWDVSSGQLLCTFSIHVGRPWSVAWSADQRLLACGTDEGTIMLWERLTGKCLMTLRSDRPYERMNISGVTGITDVQKAMLKTLGAIEQEDTFSNQPLA
jgi:WD40 repeat protein